VIFPQNASQQPVPGLAVQMRTQRPYSQLRQRQDAPALRRLRIRRGPHGTVQGFLDVPGGKPFGSSFTLRY
jgi:hypothetical protein